MKLFGLLFLLATSYLTFVAAINYASIDPLTGQQYVCGNAACHETKRDILNVHLIPHTHDDVGWLKTLDQYYYGSRTLTQRAGVQYILDSVIDELLKDANRRFIYVETAFFDRWWSEQTDIRRHQVKRLVSQGRLEFAGGAWSMNDEATVHYQSVVDQLTWGLRMLNETFGECGRPTVGWQIDPFGHSREMANIFSQSGFNAVFFGRSDYQDKERRFATKEPEVVWRGSDDLGAKSDILGGLLFNRYSPPPGFCFDVLCSDDPIIDDKRSPDYNVDTMVKKFVDYAFKQAEAYRTNNIMMTMGEDFNYQNALMWFKNLDKLIKYVNKYEPNINVLYSTPSCYVKALIENGTSFPTKQDDYFPYASDKNSFWTGYFTSRPTIKYFERQGNNFLQVCKQLYALTNLNEQDKIDLNMLRTAMGVMQHHDAVSGTEKQHVAKDYARMLDVGIQDCLITSKEALNILMSETDKYKSIRSGNRKSNYNETSYLPMDLCQLNITECEITEKNSKFIVTVYNPLAHVVNDYIKIPVTGSDYIVKDGSGAEVKTQMMTIPSFLPSQLPSRKSNATEELIFKAENLPPLGYRSYYVEEKKSYDDLYYSYDKATKLNNEFKRVQQDESEEMLADARQPFIIDSYRNSIQTESNPTLNDVKEAIDELIKASKEEIVIGNDNIQLKIDSTTGLVGSITVIENGISTLFPITQRLFYYEGMPISETASYNRPSGAYIFRPKTEQAIPIGTKPENTVIKGPLVQEIRQRFSDWASQIIRIYHGRKHIEFEWIVGPIPIADKIGKEIISRFTTDFKTNGEFYTDSNGRQMLKRVINKRPTWNLTLEEPIAGNYYPVTSMISIKDNNSQKQLYVINDRAQGGSSLQDGQVELMLHRRLLYDDSFGVGEALNEIEDGAGLVAKGTHYLLIGSDEKRDVPLAVTSRHIALKKLLQPVPFISPANNISYSQWTKNNNEFTAMYTELPANVHVLTLEPWKDRSILLRLEHFIAKNDDPLDLSKTAVINLQFFFSGIKIESFEETNLAANVWKKESSYTKWPTANKMSVNFNDNYNTNSSIDDETQFMSRHMYQRHRRISKKLKDDNKFLIYLEPMEIRTFIIKASFEY